MIEVDSALIKIKFSTIRGYKTIFWDFDGSIKDSVEAKSNAFERVFLPFGYEFATRVREHHERNGGISRQEKIPIYLSWANQSIEPKNVYKYTQEFASIVKRSVIESMWVPGVYSTLPLTFKSRILS